ncbi:MAG: metallophosphoesterase [Phycisphaerales bacterium]|nr:metallophosphoesterase [Phycisphaerales bacterium]
MTLKYITLIGLLVALSGCLRPGEDRARLDLTIGKASAEGLTIDVDEGHAAVRSLTPGEVELWAQAPVLTMTFEAETEGEWRITLLNGMATSVLEGTDSQGAIEASRLEQPRPTAQVWSVTLRAGESTTLRYAPPEADDETPFRYAVLSDVQSAIDDVGDIFSRMNEDEALQFVVSAGDLVEQGHGSELREFQRQMEALDIPLYATPGNHERGVDEMPWSQIFGRGSFNWQFQGSCFTFADSSAATIDPMVYDWMRGWLDSCRERSHAFLTHVPPIDPVGARSGGWRSRKEAAKLFTMLGRGKVDVAYYGHVHSFYSFSNGTVDAFISGGGGAIPERLDGIGRHYLVVETDHTRVRQVGVVRVD